MKSFRPDWMQEFWENLVDECTSEELRGDWMQRSADISSSSLEPPMEPRACVERGSGKHNAFTFFFFTEDPNCETCLKTKKTKNLLAEDALTQSCPERKISVI